MLQCDFNLLYYVLLCELLCVPTSGSRFCQWVWIASGSGYENPMGQTPCCIMQSTHNYGIKSATCLYLPWQSQIGLFYLTFTFYIRVADPGHTWLVKCVPCRIIVLVKQYPNVWATNFGQLFKAWLAIHVSLDCDKVVMSCDTKLEQSGDVMVMWHKTVNRVVMVMWHKTVTEWWWFVIPDSDCDSGNVVPILYAFLLYWY